MKSLYRVVLGLALVAAGCQSTPKTESTEATATDPVAQLEKQVLATHDSIMPQMGDLMRLKRDVDTKMAGATEGPARAQGEQVRRELNEADRIMMDWMHEYNGDTLKKLDQARGLTYLRTQQEKVNTLRDQLKKATADAKAYLD